MFDHLKLILPLSLIGLNFSALSSSSFVKKGANVRLRDISDDIGLLAVQGPRAEAALQPLSDTPLGSIGYYKQITGRIAGVGAFISRTG